MEDERIRIEARPGSGGFALTVKRNCSMSPRILMEILAVTALFNLGIGIAFAWLGLWMVLPFAGLELAALAAAFLVNGRHAGDYERIAVAAGQMRVEISVADKVQVHEFNPGWVRLVVKEARNDVRLSLRSHGRELEIGRHLDTIGRMLFARTLRSLLAQRT